MDKILKKGTPKMTVLVLITSILTQIPRLFSFILRELHFLKSKTLYILCSKVYLLYLDVDLSEISRKVNDTTACKNKLLVPLVLCLSIREKFIFSFPKSKNKFCRLGFFLFLVRCVAMAWKGKLLLRKCTFCEINN